MTFIVNSSVPLRTCTVRTPTKFHRWMNLEKYGKIKEIDSMNVGGLETKAGLIHGTHHVAVSNVNFRNLVNAKATRIFLFYSMQIAPACLGTNTKSYQIFIGVCFTPLPR